ncbi:unnamed protein product, partial [Coregonus sp. 'balchen']
TSHVTCLFSEDCVLACSFQPGSDEVIYWLKPGRQGPDRPLLLLQYRSAQAAEAQPLQMENSPVQMTRSPRKRFTTAERTHTPGPGQNTTPVRLVDIQLSDDIITCNSTGIYPEPKLTWSIDPPSDLSFDPGTIQNSTSTKVDDRGLYDITSTKQFIRNRTNICTVTSGTVERTATLKQQDPVQGSPRSEVSIPCSFSQSELLTFNLTWRFNQIDTILTSTYTKGTSQMYIDDQWKEQVQSLFDSGSLQLHKLTMVHQGTYSCELSTARDTHLVLTYLEITSDKPSDVSDGLSPGSITGITISAVAAVIIAAGICY